MGMTVRKKKDTQSVNKFVHKIADIPGGVAVHFNAGEKPEVKSGDILVRGKNNGYRKISFFSLAAGDDLFDKERMENGERVLCLKPGQIKKKEDILNFRFFIETDEFLRELVVEAVDIQEQYTVIDFRKGWSSGSTTVSEADFRTWEGVKVWGFVGTEEFSYPLNFAIAGTSKTAEVGDNLDVDAWLIGVTKGVYIPKNIKPYLSGIVNID